MKSMTKKEEEELLQDIESGEMISIENLNNAKESFRSYADNTFKKDKRINIRISERDLISLQKRAILEGLPYQTLISSLLHKYVNGRLIEQG